MHRPHSLQLAEVRHREVTASREEVHEVGDTLCERLCDPQRLGLHVIWARKKLQAGSGKYTHFCAPLPWHLAIKQPTWIWVL